MRLAPDYLSRTGYRLPTEAEWEYACRAGAVTSRSYGQADELLAQYAWYRDNSGERTWPVGSLKPNDLGLFDMHGNVWEWCQERGRGYCVGSRDAPAEDREDAEVVKDGELWVLRGGSFIVSARHVRSADRDVDQPDHRNDLIGFRPARTYH